MTENNSNSDNPHPEQEIIVPKKSKSEDKEKKPSAFVTWLKYTNKWLRLITIILTTVLFLTVIISASYFFGYYLLIKLWNWGFTDGGFWSGFSAIYGALILIIIPLALLSGFSGWIEDIFEIYANDAQKEFQKKLDEIDKERLTYEEKLEKTDSELLIPLITYSKLELETYYKLGLSQTQKSYKYSIIAMWVGFLLIIFGIIIYIIPSNILKIDNLEITEKVKFITIASGVVLELISGLFLWIYKNSITQLNYFYSRQIFIHNSLFAFRVAQTMKDSDEAKKEIVSKILDFNSKK
ncbi:TRADD-N-associated membrane domain-containing protein [Flavobacterium sp.]|uniref:TRADD-N-associated membrane domain-containing protein n=1 Tax=Flavobacterium sp. TaxID=239 RepID=UPI004048C6FE